MSGWRTKLAETLRHPDAAPSKLVIVRLKGGLGNQLFCYAAARRLALANDAELAIDHLSGFRRDATYKRSFALHNFSVPARLASPQERMEPFERYRRGLAIWLARKRPFEMRRYLTQEKKEFDPRLLNIRVVGKLYLDGLWQSEGYFKDVELAIRRDLTIKAPEDSLNQEAEKRIAKAAQPVALHVRWFHLPRADNIGHNVARDYYERAINFLQARISNPHFFVFSDNPQLTSTMLPLPEGAATWVSHNQGDRAAYADLWLMSQCKHFIVANSTFSWWGAWLSAHQEKIVVVPDPHLLEHDSPWRIGGLLPENWIRL